MNLQTAIDKVEDVYGFDDETSVVGEAWKLVKAELKELEALHEKIQLVQDTIKAIKNGELTELSALFAIGLIVFPQPEEIPEDVKRWAEAALRAAGEAQR